MCLVYVITRFYKASTKQNSIKDDTLGTESESLLPSSRLRGAVEYKRSWKHWEVGGNRSLYILIGKDFVRHHESVQTQNYKPEVWFTVCKQYLIFKKVQTQAKIKTEQKYTQ